MRNRRQRKLGREMIGDADHFRLFVDQLRVGKKGKRFAAQPLQPLQPLQPCSPAALQPCPLRSPTISNQAALRIYRKRLTINGNPMIERQPEDSQRSYRRPPHALGSSSSSGATPRGRARPGSAPPVPIAAAVPTSSTRSHFTSSASHPTTHTKIYPRVPHTS